MNRAPLPPICRWSARARASASLATALAGAAGKACSAPRLAPGAATRIGRVSRNKRAGHRHAGSAPLARVDTHRGREKRNFDFGPERRRAKNSHSRNSHTWGSASGSAGQIFFQQRWGSNDGDDYRSAPTKAGDQRGKRTCAPICDRDQVRGSSRAAAVMRHPPLSQLTT